MSTLRAYADLLALNRPVLTTAEVSSRLDIPEPSATRLLSRLARLGFVTRLKRGLWAFARTPNPYEVVEFLTAPYPSYISLWTALHRHGLITQVPRIVYVVSLDRSKRIRTPIATYRLHHVDPRLFGGFVHTDRTPIATPEKALFDTIYLLSTRSGGSVRVPEIEVPRNFNLKELQRWINRIPSKRRRAIVRKRIQTIHGLQRKRRK